MCVFFFTCRLFNKICETKFNKLENCRKLKILKSVKIIDYSSLLFIRVLNDLRPTGRSAVARQLAGRGGGARAHGPAELFIGKL